MQRLEKNVEIGPFCSIGKNVEIKENCKIHSNVVIDGNTIIEKIQRFSLLQLLVLYLRI